MLCPYLEKLNEMKIVLASGSPRRVDALKGLKLKFDVVPSHFAENLDKSTFKTCGDYTVENAYQKAKEVWDRLSATAATAPDVVIGADTVVILDEKIIEKPKDAADAFQILSSLSGRAHSVVTGLVLIWRGSGGEVCSSKSIETTEVHFSPLSPEVINSYIATGSPFDKAGAYGIQDGVASSFVCGLSGCYFNVTGFPTNRFCRELIKALYP